MKNLKIHKGILSVLFASTVLTTLSGCMKKQEENRQENLIGYIDEMPKNVPSSDFICYNVGNNKHIGISNQDKLLKECEKKEISTGIIIDSEATTRIEILEDVEFTKSLIEEYKIDMPVYLNIEKIITNDDLSIEQKSNLISEFVTLIEKNNIYVGLYGTSTNLSLINQYGFPISEKYDCFVIEDGMTTYNGLSSLRQDKNGNVKSTYASSENNNNLAKLIESKNLNNREQLKQTGFYVVEENNSIEQIAISCGLSVNDILEFNKISKKDLIPGTTLRIPNQIQNKTELVFPMLKREKMALYRGIDISCYQGEPSKINFEKISKNIDFAILKIGEQENKDFSTLREDIYFKDYYNECIKNNISIGGYYVTRATTVNEAIKEAKLIVNRIKDLKITFPIYIDYENVGIYEKEFSEIKRNEALKDILESVNQIFSEAGLRFGIYTNLSTYSQMVDIVGLQNLNNYEIWLSKPNEYNYVRQVLDNGPVCQTDDGIYSFGCDMNQVSWTIKDLGIGNAEGYVDYNLCYVDYKAPKQQIELPPERIFDTKEYKRKDLKKIAKTTGTIMLYIGGTLVALYVIGHRKIYKRKLKQLKKKIIKLKETEVNKIKQKSLTPRNNLTQKVL